MSNEALETKIKAAAFDRIVKHFQDNTDIQNIDLMIAGKFCRNCMYKWYHSAAQELGDKMTVETAQETIYGMPYSDFKKQYQTAATPEQMAAYEKIHAKK